MKMISQSLDPYNRLVSNANENRVVYVLNDTMGFKMAVLIEY